MDQEWERKVFVLLLDEQDSFLRAATDFLQREDELKVVGTAFGEAEALVQAQNLRPRVVLLDPSLTDGGGRKCSDLRGSEQPAAFQEGIETSSPPGAKEGCQGHLAVGALP